MEEIINLQPSLISILIALGLGALIGLERETIIQKHNAIEFGGVRTFAFIGLLGALSALLENLLEVNFILIGLVGLITMVALAYNAEQKHYEKGKPGLTSEMTALLTFLIGVLAMSEEQQIAVITTIFIITILSLREYLHSFARNIEQKEIYASIKFALIAFVILPLLPNMTFDPWEALNPYKIWLIVVLISGLNFAGYILSKLFGKNKGLALTGLFGGFVSSTAVTLSAAEQSHNKKTPTGTIIVSIMLAQAASFMMTLIELFILNRPLFFSALFPLIAVIGSLVLIGLYYYKKSDNTKAKNAKDVGVKSPFTLSSALMFGGLFSIMMLIISILSENASNAGIFVTSILSGLISLDALTVTMSQITGTSISLIEGTKVLMVGAMMSSVLKVGMLIILAHKSVKLKGSLLLSISIAIGFLSLLFI